jgi:hypothetical protein
MGFATLVYLAAADARAERSRVIVRLDVPARAESALAAPSAVAAQRAGIAAAASLVAEDLAGTGSEILRAYETIPYLAIEVDDAGLDALANARTAGTVFVDRPHAISLQESTAMIGAPLAWNAGLDGAGQAVAILDTGVDADHPFLAGKVVREVCFSGSGDCPNGARFDEGPGAARPCEFSERGCRHGTHVAGIVAGGAIDRDGVELSGVAPGAAIVAIQVFSPANDCAPYEDVPCPRTFTSDYLAALEWVYQHGAELGIAAVNMSFARDAYTSPDECDADDPATRLAFENLRSIGIAPVVAAGNGGQVGALGSPACLSSAISVGAVYDRDRFAGFPNRSWFLSFAAPGTSVGARCRAAAIHEHERDLDGRAARRRRVCDPPAAGPDCAAGRVIASLGPASRWPRWTATAVRSSTPSSGDRAPLRLVPLRRRSRQLLLLSERRLRHDVAGRLLRSPTATATSRTATGTGLRGLLRPLRSAAPGGRPGAGAPGPRAARAQERRRPRRSRPSAKPPTSAE